MLANHGRATQTIATIVKQTQNVGMRDQKARSTQFFSGIIDTDSTSKVRKVDYEPDT